MTIKTHTFPNDFRVIHEKSASSLNVSSIYIFCDIGSVHENDQCRGAAHYIEHMCFKGTHKILDSKKLFQNYDKVGAYFSAYTVERYTCYTLQCLDIYIDDCVKIIADMLLNSVFDKEECKKEYNVVVEENIKNQNDPDDFLFEITQKHLYNGSAYAYPVDTFDYHKKPFNRDNVVDFYKTFYIPSRMVVSIVSNKSFQSCFTILKHTDFVKTSHKPSLLLSNPFYIQYNIIPQSSIVYDMQEKRGIVTNVCTVGFRTCNYTSDDKFKLELLRQIVGGTYGSRLSMTLREQNGLTYTSRVYTDYYEHLGDFTIYAETDSHKLIKNGSHKGVLPVIIDILSDLIQKGVTKEEIDIAKGYLKGHTLLDLQDPETQVVYNGEEFLIYGSVPTPYAQIYDKYYKNITKKEIHDIIQKYFRPEYMSVCIVGEKVPSEKVVHGLFRKIF